MPRERHSEDHPNIVITYLFEFRAGDPVTYEVEIDGNTMILVTEDGGAAPDWASLEFSRCDDCTLDPVTTSHCPVAVNLNQAATRFRADFSTRRVKVTVTTRERTYFKETSLNAALYSLFGLIMSTTACPILDFLKPMARFHLPFASMEETVMRTTSMYLMGQYFVARDGGSPDFALENLDTQYQKVTQRNHAFCKRLSRITSGDAEHNAIIALNSFACMMALAVKHELKYLAYLWESY